MGKKGHRRTQEQVHFKIKFLQQAYARATRGSSEAGADTCCYFTTLDCILGGGVICATLGGSEPGPEGPDQGAEEEPPCQQDPQAVPGEESAGLSREATPCKCYHCPLPGGARAGRLRTACVALAYQASFSNLCTCEHVPCHPWAGGSSCLQHRGRGLIDTCVCEETRHAPDPRAGHSRVPSFHKLPLTSPPPPRPHYTQHKGLGVVSGQLPLPGIAGHSNHGLCASTAALTVKGTVILTSQSGAGLHPLCPQGELTTSLLSPQLHQLHVQGTPLHSGHPPAPEGSAGPPQHCRGTETSDIGSRL
ncbi:uncharacterized protein LOC142827199 [Pelodiscus sinensis]|uniref:uncharacterized protein LOC142827199 n=1 Tax=Pelodiscus sinensis TaxID=13735 RepID=UPI003F6C141C